MSSHANMAGSSEYLTPLIEFFLVTIACHVQRGKKNYNVLIVHRMKVNRKQFLNGKSFFKVYPINIVKCHNFG